MIKILQIPSNKVHTQIKKFPRSKWSTNGEHEQSELNLTNKSQVYSWLTRLALQNDKNKSDLSDILECEPELETDQDEALVVKH